MPIMDKCFLCLDSVIYPLKTDCGNLVCLSCFVCNRRSLCPLCGNEISIHQVDPYIQGCAMTMSSLIGLFSKYYIYSCFIADTPETLYKKEVIKKLLGDKTKAKEFIDKRKNKKVKDLTELEFQAIGYIQRKFKLDKN